MRRLRIGDRVRIVAANEYSIPLGQVGVVICVRYDLYEVDVYCPDLGFRMDLHFESHELVLENGLERILREYFEEDEAVEE